MKELTSGKPIKLIIGFALPVLLGLAFQQAYTLTDTIIIGRQLGKNSLAAVGSTASVVSLMFNIINGLVTGFAIVIAKNFGAGDHDEMRRSIARTITFSAAATAPASSCAGHPGGYFRRSPDLSHDSLLRAGRHAVLQP